MDNGLFSSTLITVICAMIASSGMWTFLDHRAGKKDAMSKMLVGLGHDRIVDLGKKYIERGSITHDEYENLVVYLYEPYEALGGNGSAKRIMDEVKRLPITTQ